MSQFGIRNILEKNKIVPVVTITDLKDIDDLVSKLLKKNISCIEVTLRTPVAMEALAYLKLKYSNELSVGVGTVINIGQLIQVKEIGVDFIVSPGLMLNMSEELQEAGIAFIPGVVTPTEIMQGIDLGYNTFKLFPADIVGGVKLLKTYAGLFPDLKFCPTGGINEKNYEEYLNLPNVICVGGSWVVN